MTMDNEPDEKNGHHPMNGWEALAKIVSDVTFATVFLGILGMIYLLVR
jgi:hypothetical protein